jgi:hypothetical protein
MLDRVNLLKINTPNVGDLYSAPNRHFFLPGFQLRDVDDDPVDCNTLILGGGGLFHFKHLHEHVKRAGKVIVWGAGVNRHRHPYAQAVYPEWADNKLVGVRDWCEEAQRFHGFDWVPCPSCMLGEWDRPFPAQYKAVLYDHADFGVGPIEGVPHLRNHNVSIETVAKFLSSGETVLTTTYHGVYWATLLGKPVVLLKPFSSKFRNFKHPPVVCSDPREWRKAAESAIAYPDALMECREANNAFHSKVIAYVQQNRPPI